MKLVRALLAAALAVGATAAIQVATTQSASAQQGTQICTNCWDLVVR